MIVVVLLWWAISAWLDRPYLLPAPLRVATEAGELLLEGDVFDAFIFSGRRLFTAYLLAAAVGIPLGLAMGLSPWMEALFDWLIEILRPISGIAWIPVLLVVFGIGNTLPISIIFIAAVFPFILNTASGVRHVDRRLINAARVLGASRWRILRRVTLPAAVPDILTGARIAASNSWMALIVAELIGAPNGMGFAIGYAQELGNATLVMVWIVYVGIFGYILDAALQLLQRRLTPWTVGLKVGGA
jgi:ABC-type nitrate/sulfonate/bicarbonate transport system permease component